MLTGREFLRPILFVLVFLFLGLFVVVIRVIDIYSMDAGRGPENIKC